MAPSLFSGQISAWLFSEYFSPRSIHIYKVCHKSATCYQTEIATTFRKSSLYMYGVQFSFFQISHGPYTCFWMLQKRNAHLYKRVSSLVEYLSFSIITPCRDYMSLNAEESYPICCSLLPLTFSHHSWAIIQQPDVYVLTIFKKIKENNSHDSRHS